MINFTLWLTVCFGGKFRQKRTIALGTGSGSDAGFRGDNFTMKSCQPRLFNEDKMAQQTPLYEQHTLCGARMVDFHGWMMPLHYGSQIDEHHAVRTDAGMFDVSHMTIPSISAAAAPGSFCVICWRTMWRSSPKAAKPFTRGC